MSESETDLCADRAAFHGKNTDIQVPLVQDTIKERALVLYEKEQARERERRRREEDDLSAWGARFGDDADPEGIVGTKGNGNSGTDSTERSERDSAAVIKAREEAEARKLKVFEESESEVRAMESLLADCIMKEAWPVVKGGHDGAKRLVSPSPPPSLLPLPPLFPPPSFPLSLSPSLTLVKAPTLSFVLARSLPSSFSSACPPPWMSLHHLLL